MVKPQKASAKNNNNKNKKQKQNNKNIQPHHSSKIDDGWSKNYHNHLVPAWVRGELSKFLVLEAQVVCTLPRSFLNFAYAIVVCRPQAINPAPPSDSRCGTAAIHARRGALAHVSRKRVWKNSQLIFTVHTQQMPVCFQQPRTTAVAIQTSLWSFIGSRPE